MKSFLKPAGILSCHLMLSLLLVGCVDDDDNTQQEEASALQEQLDQIFAFAQPVDCVGPDQWAAIAYGAKACGGPAGYLAYHNSVDLNSLNALLADYEAAEQAYNEKWMIVSDCALILPPLGIECQGGEPVFISN